MEASRIIRKAEDRMRLNISCMRSCLLIIEKSPEEISFQDIIDMSEFTVEDVLYSLKQLKKRDFIGLANSMKGYPDSNGKTVSHITPEGHEFIEFYRDNTVWKMTMNHCEQINNYSFSAIKTIFSKLIGLKN
ncbi:MAG: DUF2513 domain-containing protein [Nitrosopumilales archaeon]|nr:MAG: DUF2513 domain-containing protein [Nitrosopumilales archaeon]RPJ31545.1 MAG: DUF2513 domain-containing protein [Nitrosopumilales archaeon]RPJ32811.1 MAG: DUF2513 domain-containing protein [Nitrosopumilales archaeon]